MDFSSSVSELVAELLLFRL